MELTLKPVSVTTTASVCKRTMRATWALLFWPTWPSFLATERGLKKNVLKGADITKVKSDTYALLDNIRNEVQTDAVLIIFLQIA